MDKKAKKIPGYISILIKLGILVFVVVSVVKISITQVELSEKKAILQQKKAEEEAISVSNEQLEKLIQSGNYNQLIERALRENGYVRSDEKVYTDVAGN